MADGDRVVSATAADAVEAAVGRLSDSGMQVFAWAIKVSDMDPVPSLDLRTMCNALGISLGQAWAAVEETERWFEVPGAGDTVHEVWLSKCTSRVQNTDTGDIIAARVELGIWPGACPELAAEFHVPESVVSRHVALWRRIEDGVS